MTLLLTCLFRPTQKKRCVEEIKMGLHYPLLLIDSFFRAGCSQGARRRHLDAKFAEAATSTNAPIFGYVAKAAPSVVDVCVLTVAADLAVSAEGENVGSAVSAKAFVLVGTAPWVYGQALFEVGTAPV